MSNIETHEEMLVNTNLFEFKVGNSVGQSRSNRDSYFHLVFEDHNTNFTKPANIEFDENEETIKFYYDGNSENEPRLLSGQRSEDNMDEMDDDDDAEKNYLLIFDEETKSYTLECLDYKFHISNDSSADVNGISQKLETSYSDDDEELEREINYQLTQKGTEEESQPDLPDDFADEEEDYVEKFTEEMEIEGNGENGISNDIHEYEDDGDTWMEDDHLEEVDAPSPQALSPDDMYGPIEDGDVTKDDVTGSSNSSSTSSSSSSDSDNSRDDGSDSSESELEPEFRDFEAEMKQSMNSVAKSPRTKPNSNIAGGKPISLEAYLGGGGGAEEQDQDDSSDESD